VSISASLGMRELEMFDFALPILLVGSVAVLYLWLVAPRLIPERRPPLTDVAPRVFDAKLRLNEDSFADGKPPAEGLAHARARAHESLTHSTGQFVAGQAALCRDRARRPAALARHRREPEGVRAAARRNAACRGDGRERDARAPADERSAPGRGSRHARVGAR